MPYRVSIPHRYAKNPADIVCAIGRFLFQFLIGTLKTVYGYYVYYGFIEFQFLIGTLKT